MLPQNCVVLRRWKQSVLLKPLRPIRSDARLVEIGLKVKGK